MVGDQGCLLLLLLLLVLVLVLRALPCMRPGHNASHVAQCAP